MSATVPPTQRALVQVERLGQQVAVEGVDEVPRRHVSRISPAIDQHRAITARQRLDHDLRGVPRLGASGA